MCGRILSPPAVRIVIAGTKNKKAKRNVICLLKSYLYRQIKDKKVWETIDFGTTKAVRMYFALSNLGHNAFAGNKVIAPKFEN